MEKVASERANTNKNVDPDDPAAPGLSSEPPPRSGEKSVGNGAGKGHDAKEGRDHVRASGGPRSFKSKSSTHLPSDTQARHDALVAAKALMQFPPSSGDPKVYQEWRARVEALLDFADGGPEPDVTRTPTVNGPEAGGRKAHEPQGQPPGER